MFTYDSPILQTNSVNAATLSNPATLFTFSGPAGRRGRIVSVSCAVTTGVTVAANLINVGSVATDGVYATLTVPVSAANSVANAAVLKTGDANLIPANAPVLVKTDGGGDAGAGTVTIVTAWF